VIQHQERLSHHRSLRRSRWRGTPRQQARPSRGSGGSSKAGDEASRTCIISVSNVESQSDAAKEARACKVCKSTITPAAPPAGAATHDEPQHKRVRVGALLALQSRRAIQKIVSNRAHTAGTAGAPSAAGACGADLFIVDTQRLLTTAHMARV